MTRQRTNSEEPEIVSPTEARQGRPTFVLRILIVSLLVLVIGFAITYFYAEATDEDGPAHNQPTEENITEIEPPPNVPPADFGDNQ